MADLAATKIVQTKPRAGVSRIVMADGVSFFPGMLVGIEGGYANHWADGANDVFAGVLMNGDSRTFDGVLTGATGDDRPPAAHVDTSGVTLTGLSVGGSPVATNVGDVVYSADSDPASITIDATGRTHPIGYLSAYHGATDQEVTLFTPTEALAQATA